MMPCSTCFPIVLELKPPMPLMIPSTDRLGNRLPNESGGEETLYLGVGMWENADYPHVPNDSYTLSVTIRGLLLLGSP